MTKETTHEKPEKVKLTFQVGGRSESVFISPAKLQRLMQTTSGKPATSPVPSPVSPPAKGEQGYLGDSGLSLIRSFDRNTVREYLPSAPLMDKLAVQDMFTNAYARQVETSRIFPAVDTSIIPPDLQVGRATTVTLVGAMKFPDPSGMPVQVDPERFRAGINAVAKDVQFYATAVQPKLTVTADTISVHDETFTVTFSVTLRPSASGAVVSPDQLSPILRGCTREGLIRSLKPILIAENTFYACNNVDWASLHIDRLSRVQQDWNDVRLFLTLANLKKSFSIDQCVTSIFAAHPHHSLIGQNLLFQPKTMSKTRIAVLENAFAFWRECGLIEETTKVKGVFSFTPLGNKLAYRLNDYVAKNPAMKDDLFVVSRW